MSVEDLPLPRRSLLLLAVGVACSDPGGTSADVPRPGSDVVWEVLERGSTAKPGVDTSGKTIFFYTGVRDLVALDAATGRQKWRTRVINGAGTAFGKDIAVAGDVVAVGEVDVYAFRASTGERLWAHGRSPGGNEGERTIATDGRYFYLAGVDGLLSKVDAVSGRDVWVRSLALGDTAVVAFGPVVHGGRVYVCGNRYQHRGVVIDRGSLSAFDKETGALLWRVRYEPNRAEVASWCFSPVAAVNGFVVSGVTDGRVIAHDPATGAVRWTARGELTGTNGELIYVASDGTNLISTSSGTSRVTRHDPATGAVMWRNSGGIGSPMNQAAIGANATAVTHSGAVIVYDLTSGAVLWMRPAAGHLGIGGTSPYRAHAEPLIHNGLVYFNASDGIRAKRPR